MRTTPIQTYARIAGVVFLAALLFAGFGEVYAPNQLIVPGNATATAHNVITSNLFLRLGFVGYLAEAITDVLLAFLLYVLLRPVHANLALLAVFFRLMATATFAIAELFYFAPTLILGGDGYLNTFSSEQLNTLALLSLNLHEAAFQLFNFFFGLASIILGFLMFRSGYLPRVIGILWVVGGVGFVIENIVWVVAPAYASPGFDVPQPVAMLSLGVWLLLRGVDVAKWNEREGLAQSRQPVPSL